MQEVSLIAAAFTSLLAGVLSFLSPCVLPLMPAYLSYVSGISLDELQEGDDSHGGRPVLMGSLGFIAGFSAIFIAFGASATALGRVLRYAYIPIGSFELRPAHIAGMLIILFGLHLIGLLRIPFLYREQRLQLGGGGGVLQAFVLGAAFAFGWTPCIGPVLAGILAIAGSQETLGRGLFLLSIYSLGLGIPFLLTALSLDRFYRVFDLIKRHFRKIEVVSGVLLIIVGLMISLGQLTRLNSYLSFLTDFITRIEELLL